jgi:hypothetical protein
MARKRAPGAGRKPQGEFAGKSVTFATRLTPMTRRELARAAEANGRSLSQEAERRLSASFKRLPGKARNRALAFTVATLASRVEEETGLNWREDAFTGTALRYAVEMLLTFLAAEFQSEPKIPPAVETAASKLPQGLAEQYRKPAGVGHMLAYNLTREIEQAKAQSEPARSLQEFNDKFNEWSQPIFFNASMETLAEIARDLDQKENGNG